MMKQIVAAAILLACCALSCQGPAGPSGSDSLFDASIQPKVVYTYPPPNSRGPYDNIAPPAQIQLRFNKYMDRVSVKKALSVWSPNTTTRIDTSTFYALGGDLFLVYLRDSLTYYYSLHWKIGEIYYLTVSTSAKDINGNVLETPYSMTFSPEPYFRVQSVTPSTGALNVGYGPGITLYFNSQVDTSVLSKIQMSPAVPGHWSIDDGDSTVVTFSYLNPQNGLKLNTHYTITVGAQAHDKYNNQLFQQFTSDFTTAPFMVTTTYPPNGAANVYPSSSIEVDFTTQLNPTTVATAVTILPATVGTFSFYSSNFTFVPTIGLLGDTTYVVTVDTSIRSLGGDRLAAPYTFSFSTIPFGVINSSPYDGETGVYRWTNIEIDCNGPVDTTTIVSAFSMKDSAGTLVPGVFAYYASSYFYFFPSHVPLAQNATFTVTISTALQSMRGKHLKAPYTFSFVTGY